MSQFHVAPAVCRRDHPFLATVATSLNVARKPALREQILSGRFQRFRCPTCGSVDQVDSPFLYIDPRRRVLALVDGRDGGSTDRQMATWEYEAELEDLGRGAKRWDCFRVRSIRDLRERLVAKVQGLDYNSLLGLLTPRGRLLGKRRRERVLRQRTVRCERGRVFACRLVRSATWETAIRNDQRSIPTRARWRKVDLDSDALPGDPTLAREDAGAFLAEKARRRKIDRRELEGGLHRLRYLLPRGAGLRRDERRALNTLRRVAHRKKWDAVALQIATIFAGLDLSPSVLRDVPPGKLDKFCDTLLALPWAEAEANREIQRLDIAPSPRTAAYEWETGTLFFGIEALQSTDEIRKRLAHEIGHCVHDAHANSIDCWLQRTFGWEMYDARVPAEIDKWVAQMGGWPHSWKAKTRATWRDRIRDSVIPAGTQGLPGRILAPRGRPNFREDPLKAEIDAATAVGFRAAKLLQLAQPAWWQDPDLWLRFKGRRFALNYYYGGLMVVKDATLRLIAYRADHARRRPLADYAAMSPMEFFAELYVVMRNKVSGFRPGPMPRERIRDQFFLNVWGRHARATALATPPSWRWAMLGFRAAHNDVGTALHAHARHITRRVKSRRRKEPQAVSIL
jgi:hypothetical protein